MSSTPSLLESIDFLIEDGKIAQTRRTWVRLTWGLLGAVGVLLLWVGPVRAQSAPAQPGGTLPQTTEQSD